MRGGAVLAGAAATVVLLAAVSAGPLRRLPPVRRLLVGALALAVGALAAVEPWPRASEAGAIAGLALTVRSIVLALRAREEASPSCRDGFRRLRAIVITAALLGAAVGVASGPAGGIARIILARGSVDPPGGVP